MNLVRGDAQHTGEIPRFVAGVSRETTWIGTGAPVPSTAESSVVAESGRESFRS